jgi:hypothetical protein
MGRKFLALILSDVGIKRTCVIYVGHTVSVDIVVSSVDVTVSIPIRVPI